jgi:hypothetical protein
MRFSFAESDLVLAPELAGSYSVIIRNGIRPALQAICAI